MNLEKLPSKKVTAFNDLVSYLVSNHNEWLAALSRSNIWGHSQSTNKITKLSVNEYSEKQSMVTMVPSLHHGYSLLNVAQFLHKLHLILNFNNSYS